MGKRGPAPKPTKLRLLHGDRKDRVNTDEPVPSDGLPQLPPNVSSEVAEVWDYTLRELSVMGIATPADRDALLCFCEAVVVHRQASADIAWNGITVEGLTGGSVRNPAVLIQKDAAAQIRVFAQEFGLTPSARSQIQMGPQKAAQGAGRLLSG